jgi:hypothetical protein
MPYKEFIIDPPGENGITAAGLFCFSAKAQLVNIEARRIHNGCMRRAGEFNVGYNYSGINNKKLTVFSTSLTLQQKIGAP